MELGARISLTDCLAACAGAKLTVGDGVLARLADDRDVVDRAAAGPDPVYGLNTGLGAKLGHRIAPADIPDFQQQIIDGRAVAVGDPLPPGSGHALTIARLISAAGGGSGMSLPVFEHLCTAARAGIDPVIPETGSIEACDLTQNAVWARAILGQGRCWVSGSDIAADEALSAAGLVAPDLAPKDGMALINHGALTVALAMQGLDAVRFAQSAVWQAVLLSYAGYDANRDILAADLNGLRVSPGQSETAAWLRAELERLDHTPRRVQEALSFRTVSPVLGAAADALQRAESIWEDEANGLQDSPAVVSGQAMRSTPNFVAPALAAVLENLCLFNAMLAAGAVQRMQRMMDPQLSGLPRYLAPEEGASAGLVPLQKTAAALASEIRRSANPVHFDIAPVSEGVEDFAPETPAIARKLSRQSKLLEQLAALEALIAAQAIDLRGVETTRGRVLNLHTAIREVVPMFERDRAIEADISSLAVVLRRFRT